MTGIPDHQFHALLARERFDALRAELHGAGRDRLGPRPRPPRVREEPDADRQRRLERGIVPSFTQHAA